MSTQQQSNPHLQRRGVNKHSAHGDGAFTNSVWRWRGWTARHTRALVTCLLVALLVQPFGGLPQVVAADDDSFSLEEKLETKGTIILRDASLVEWLFAIQKEWGIDIVVGNELQREIVNGAFTDTTLREVLTSILVSRGYGYRQVGKSLLIIRLDEMNIKPDQRTVLLPLEFLNPQEVESSIQLLLSQTGQVQSIPSSHSLFIIDTPDVIERVRKFLDELEANARRVQERNNQQLGGGGLGGSADSVPGLSPAEGAGVPEVVEVEEHIEIFHPQYITATALAETIQTLVLDARVTANDEEAKVIVAASPAGIDAAQQLLARLDVPRKQVRITAYMYDVSVEVMERLGFNWSQAGRGRINGSGDPQSVFGFDSNSFSTGSTAAATTATTGTTDPLDPTAVATTAASTATSTTMGGLMTLSNLSRHLDITAVIQAMETTDGARLLARPNIMAYDRMEATFQSVQEIPVQQLTQTSEGGNIGTTEFREAGISLTVTPRIMADNSVLLSVTPEFSVLNGFNNGQPIIDRRAATTTLSLRNGESSVIAGLVRRNEVESQMGVPGLMNWKHLGKLFRNHDTTVSESELVVFIRAEVVDAGFQGDARDLMAHSTVNQLVDQIPYATPAPIVDSCTDPYCPYHNPRPRYSGDYKGMTPVHNYEYYHSTPSQSYEQPLYQQQMPSQQMTPTLADPVVEPTPQAAPESPAQEAKPLESVNFQLPPPVIIDEMARRYQQRQGVIARLPDVTGAAARMSRPAPIVVRPSRQASAPNRTPHTANTSNRFAPAARNNQAPIR